MRPRPSDGLAGQGRFQVGGGRSGSHGAVGMGDEHHRLAVLAAVVLLSAGLLGGLVAGAPNAAAGGPPDDPGNQGQDQGKDEEKRPDHAGQNGGKDDGGEDDQGSSAGGEDGSEDEGSQDDGPSGNKGNGPPDDKGNGASGDEGTDPDDEDDGSSEDKDTGPGDEDEDDGSSHDEDAVSDDEKEEEEPSPDDRTDPHSSQDHAHEDERGDDPLREETTTEDTEQVELLDGQAPLVAPIIEPAVPEAGQLVHLEAGAWDPDGVIVAIDWFLPDGTWLTGAQVSHVFELPGNHTLEVVATDGQGYTTTVTVDVPVLPATTPTSEGVLAADDQDKAAWGAGTDADEPLRSSGVGTGGGGSDPLTDTPPSPERPDTDGPLAVMAVVAAFLVAAAALVTRVE